MFLIKPSFHFLTEIDRKKILSKLEFAGRICYKSEAKITEKSAENFITKILLNGHESIIEHFNVTVKIICDRGVTHELVRHRLVSYSQESTRYCNYKGGVTYIIPPWVGFKPGNYTHSDAMSWMVPFNADQTWFCSMLDHEDQYIGLLEMGWSPQQARSVLPNSLKTEIIVTTNLREWRHILKLRTSKAAHPQMQEIMIPLLEEFKSKIPIIFGDINQ